MIKEENLWNKNYNMKENKWINKEHWDLEKKMLDYNLRKRVFIYFNEEWNINEEE